MIHAIHDHLNLLRLNGGAGGGGGGRKCRCGCGREHSLVQIHEAQHHMNAITAREESTGYWLKEYKVSERLRILHAAEFNILYG